MDGKTFDSLAEKERDNFVKFMLSEKEIRAAVFLATARGKVRKTPEELLEFCFALARKKAERLKEKIAARRRPAAPKTQP